VILQIGHKDAGNICSTLFAFQPREEGECVGRGFTVLGEQERKKCSREIRIVCSEFLSWTDSRFVNSFCRIFDGEDLQTGNANQNSHQDLTVTRFISTCTLSASECGRRNVCLWEKISNISVTGKAPRHT